MGLVPASPTLDYAIVLNDVDIIITIEILYMKSIWAVADGGCVHFVRLVHTGFYVIGEI